MLFLNNLNGTNSISWPLFQENLLKFRPTIQVSINLLLKSRTIYKFSILFYRNELPNHYVLRYEDWLSTPPSSDIELSVKEIGYYRLKISQLISFKISSPMPLFQIH